MGGWHFIPFYIKRKANTEAALTWKIEVVTWLYFYWPLFQLWSQFVPPRKFPLTTHLIILFSLLAYVWYLTYYISIYKYVSSTFPKKENYLSFVLQWTIFSRNMSNFHYLSSKLGPDVVCFINSPRLKFKLKLKRFWIWSHCENSNFGRESLFVV